ncbi:MAG: 30S ribosomal protein S4e [Candidatus Bathyarchaeia archaeon]
MGKKGGSKHLKRFKAPSFWPIHVKEKTWTIKPSPGPHSIHESIPLLLIVRDILGYAKTAREAKIIISQGKIKVDGKIRKDKKYPVGLMDIIEIENVETPFRILPIYGKGLTLIEIPKDEATFKLCRIENKTTIKKGNIQLNLHDGRNLLVKVENPKNPVEDVYKVGDTIQLKIPEGKPLAHIKFEEGSCVLVTSGANMGRCGKVISVIKGTATRPTIVSLEDSIGKFQTIFNYTFVVGKEKPLIKLLEPQLIKAEGA